MTPRHRLNGSSTEFIQGQSSTRYSVVTMNSSYKTGDVVRVWIEDNQSTGYRGILLQARRTSGNTPLGRWRNPPANTKLITCANENDAITHDNTMVKTTNAVYEWVPSQNYGDIEFVATVAEMRTLFWVQLKTSTLTGGASQLMYSERHLVLTAFPLLISLLMQY
ncbi:unnamed protein product [Clavelina lepadiformis]|uniref:Reelin domain-containing protein n=1 Tax=Clavelina lepadiformis TaxID=159417 RepID=A0ABP0GZ32_CLALP